MSNQILAQTTAGVCVGCGRLAKRTESLCSDCYDTGDWELCGVCGEWQHTDSCGQCRHLFWTDNGYYGSGSAYFAPDSDESREMQENIRQLLTALPGLADALAVALKGSYAIWAQDGLLGVSLHVQGPESSNADFAIPADPAWDADSPLCRAVCWLLSLECGKTGEADTLTLEWIRRGR